MGLKRPTIIYVLRGPRPRRRFWGRYGRSMASFYIGRVFHARKRGYISQLSSRRDTCERGGRTLYARDANRFGGVVRPIQIGPLRAVTRPRAGESAWVVAISSARTNGRHFWPPRSQNRLGSEPLWSAVTERSNGPTADFHSTPILAMRGRVLRVVTISMIFMRMSRPMTLRLQQVRGPYTGGSRCPSGFPQHWRREVARAEH